MLRARVLQGRVNAPEADGDFGIVGPCGKVDPADRPRISEGATR